MQTNDNTPRKGAMYLRKSRADIEKEKVGKFETLAHHEQELSELANKMEQPIDDVFKEIVSGESIYARVEFRKLMEGVQRREYAYVFCHAVDRLGRGDAMEYGWVLSTFRFSGTKIVTPGKVYDPEDPFDMQSLQFQMFISEAEYNRIKSRLKSGKEACAREGQFMGSVPPFGYDKAMTPDKKRTLAPNDKAPIVREVFERMASGEAAYSIAQDFNRRGVKSSRGARYDASKIRAIARNPVYKGTTVWGAIRYSVEGRDGMRLKKVRSRRDDAITVKGLHEAIVSEELWEAANKAETSSPKVKSGVRLRNPLARLMHCSKCGSAMPLTGQNGNTLYYRHSQYSECHAEPCMESEVIEAVACALSELAADYEVRERGGDDGAAEHEQKLTTMRRALAENDRRKSKLVELYSADAISIEEFRDRRAPLDRDAELLRQAIRDEEEFKPTPIHDIVMSLKDAARLVADDSIPAKERNDALRQVVEDIKYANEGGHLSIEITVRE